MKTVMAENFPIALDADKIRRVREGIDETCRAIDKLAKRRTFDDSQAKEKAERMAFFESHLAKLQSWLS